MGKGRDDRGGAKEHRPGLRRSLWNYDPWGDAWALAPCTQGWRRHCQRIETSTEERENKLPTSNLHPMPATSTARGHPPLRERKTTGPHLPNPEPSLGTAERGGGEEGQSTCHQPGTPARWGLPHPQKAPGSIFPTVDTSHVVSDHRSQSCFGFGGYIQGPMCLVSTTQPQNQPSKDDGQIK